MSDLNKSSVPVSVEQAVGAVLIPTQPRSVTGSSRWLLWLLGFALWLPLFWVLSTDWSINEQYSYGWMVPFLGFAAFWQRWADRPGPRPSSGRGLITVVLGLALVAALPIRLIEEANPEWRLILWGHGIWAAVVSLLVLGYQGGYSWVRHFLFVAMAPLISVPLPMTLEKEAVQRLTSFVTFVTSELANWTGTPAFQHGNLIEVSTGTLGVEEACSGIRSLQSLLLVSLFLGEFYRFRFGRRLGLIVVGILIAFLTNVGRTYVLVRVAAAEGLRASEQIHDSAATVALVVALGAIFLSAVRLRGPELGGEAVLEKGGPADPGLAAVPPRNPPSWMAWGAVLWLLAVAVGVEVWYSSHETIATTKASWTIREPSSTDGFEPIEIPERSRAILRYSAGHCMTWRDGSASQWRLYYLRWEAGRNSAQLAKAHTPEICLSGAGGQLRQRLGEWRVHVGNLPLTFDHYIFDFSGRSLHVFYCLWEDQNGQSLAALSEDGTQQSRLAAVFAGRRHLGQTVVEVAVRGPSSAEEARQRFASELERLVIH